MKAMWQLTGFRRSAETDIAFSHTWKVQTMRLLKQARHNMGTPILILLPVAVSPSQCEFELEENIKWLKSLCLLPRRCQSRKGSLWKREKSSFLLLVTFLVFRIFSMSKNLPGFLNPNSKHSRVVVLFEAITKEVSINSFTTELPISVTYSMQHLSSPSSQALCERH